MQKKYQESARDFKKAIQIEEEAGGFYFIANINLAELYILSNENKKCEDKLKEIEGLTKEEEDSFNISYLRYINAISIGDTKKLSSYKKEFDTLYKKQKSINWSTQQMEVWLADKKLSKSLNDEQREQIRAVNKLMRAKGAE